MIPNSLTWANWLVRAAIARYFLGEFLRRGNTSRGFKEHLLDRLNRLRRLGISANQVRDLTRALSDLSNGQGNGRLDSRRSGLSGRAFTPLQRAYGALSRVSLATTPQRLDHVQTLDPLYAFFPAPEHGRPSAQLQFLKHGLSYLANAGEDSLFSRLFWQAERVRCLVYRHCVQRPMTPGLLNFIRTYDRKSPMTRILGEVEVESSGRLCGLGHGLKSLEVRTSPARDKDLQSGFLTRLRQKRDTLRATGVPEQVSAWQNCECGLVLHFLKFRGGDNDRGVPRAFDCGNHADPMSPNNSAGFRWQGFYRDAKFRADAIAATIRAFPRFLQIFRGIDMCRDEHGVPTWVMAPLFLAVHTAADMARVAGSRSNNMSKVYRRGFTLKDGDRNSTVRADLPHFHTTAHVGEDFVHLTTGLRYMDEAMEYLRLRPGDRIGHGLALGVDVPRWATKTTRLAMPREDRWLDLIWERRWHARPGSRFENDRRAFVEDEMVRLANEIFGRSRRTYDWTPQRCQALVDQLYSPRSLSRIGFPNGPMNRDPPTCPVLHALERYLTEGGVYHRCREIQWVCVADEAAAITELQSLVRRRYANGGITVEVNPTSNLLVGDLTDMNSHPLWRLAPELGANHGPTLRMCVGSDDPLPFDTTLPHEYQFLFDALVLAGKSNAEARKWLATIRTLSMESRFTVADST